MMLCLQAAGRVTAPDLAGGNVPGHDCARAYDGSIAYRHPLQDGRMGADEYVSSDADRFFADIGIILGYHCPLAVIEIVKIGVVDDAVHADTGVISDGDTLMTYDRGTAETHMIADGQGRVFPDDEKAGLLSSDHVVVPAVLQVETIAGRKIARQAHLEFRHAIAATSFSQTDAARPQIEPGIAGGKDRPRAPPGDLHASKQESEY